MSTNPVNVESQCWNGVTVPLDLEPSGPLEQNHPATEDSLATDYYEILRVAPQADHETIERVYRTLAARFHPATPDTGDAKTFSRVQQAWDTLSDNAARAEYNLLRQTTREAACFRLGGREFFNGVRGGQNRRLGVLCILYRQRISNHEWPGLTLLELEQLTGCTRDELTSALWYLREKSWAAIGEFTTYHITGDGFDAVESKLEDRSEFRSLATWCYYPLREDLRGSAHSSGNYALPLEFELAIASEPDGDVRDFALQPFTNRADRFRLRGREFFEGIRGEQLRRLAVLCLLYRQAACELPGLTALDLERVTGCTREEIGPALWYLREKRWVKYGEFTEYSITAAGFDVVEKKLDEWEAARAPKWAVPEQSLIRTEDTVNMKMEQQLDTNSWGWLNPSHCDENALPSRQSVSAPAVADSGARKRVVFSMGGKGGVGKTSVMTGLAEWFEDRNIPVTLLDLDTENKACGSLTHFFGGRVPKINIYTPAGLDAFVDILAADSPAILADMGAGAGYVTHDWFEKMYPDVNAAGVVFTAVGVVTSDPASVESVLAWAAALQHRVDYVVIENHLAEYNDFSYWRGSEQAEEFRQRFQPAILRIDYRLSDLENAARGLGVTLGRVAGRKTDAPELRKASLVMRAQSYRRRMFEEFDKVKELLLP